MEIQVEVTRTHGWVYQARLRYGRNVPYLTRVSVDPADMSEEARRVLLDVGRGEYRDVDGVYAHEGVVCAPGVSTSRAEIVVDAFAPTTEEIEAAIFRAAEEARKEPLLAEENDEAATRRKELAATNRLLDEAGRQRARLADLLREIPQHVLGEAAAGLAQLQGIPLEEFCDRLEECVPGYPDTRIFDVRG